MNLGLLRMQEALCSLERRMRRKMVVCERFRDLMDMVTTMSR